MTRSVGWRDGTVVAVDQTAPPHEFLEIRLSCVDEVIQAIRRRAIRGAPATGIAGALAVALSARAHTRADGRLDEIAVHIDARRIANTRPADADLGPAVRRVLGKLGGGAEAVLAEARRVLDEDDQQDRAAAERAADLVELLCGPRPLRVLTRCTVGPTDAVAVGHALGTIRALHERGRISEVLFGRSRPLMRGARPIAWELVEAGVEHRVLVGSAGPAALAAGMIDCVLIGADRVCANGEVAGTIGIRSLALAASRACVPFLVVVSESTVDHSVPDGATLVAEVVRAGSGEPVFDVIPTELITAVVTRSGLHRPAATPEEQAS